MKKNIKIIKSDDFKYPLKTEGTKSKISIPSLTTFGFEYNNSIKSILKNKKSYYQDNKEKNLNWWDTCIRKNFIKLKSAYVHTLKNHNQYLIKNGAEPSKDRYIYRLQFDIYAETVYNVLISSKNIAFQILNIYYNLNIEENKVSAKSIKKKMTDSFIEERLVSLEEHIKSTYKIRNSFTHKFPENQKAYRADYSKKGNLEKQSTIIRNEFKPQEIMLNIDESIRFFAIFINDLKMNMKLSS
ncbi:hypothetical protein [Jejuia spongiicola]|uniref:Cthe-2314-like HEPN domain-containing protein n=1 Tax=Jejuia spongiicola TaxID=2942207 RepID=A0ABT0QHJ7_9FLAO|nr:hypothetical protein [Jejuia spongiicola]MCL6296360.1 hypothetical protein [Jejuia spongiicola]